MLALYDYVADVRADFHDIRGDAHYSGSLDLNSHRNSQKLAKELQVGSLLPAGCGLRTSAKAAL